MHSKYLFIFLIFLVGSINCSSEREYEATEEAVTIEVPQTPEPTAIESEPKTTDPERAKKIQAFRDQISNEAASLGIKQEMIDRLLTAKYDPVECKEIFTNDGHVTNTFIFDQIHEVYHFESFFVFEQTDGDTSLYLNWVMRRGDYNHLITRVLRNNGFKIVTPAYKAGDVDTYEKGAIVIVGYWRPMMVSDLLSSVGNCIGETKSGMESQYRVTIIGPKLK
ncbi:MAG: hypothetical protein IH946_06890 [Bacteroidetes bacterium]|nr:hypothetical protein [Bacteroidota bacterium]